MKKIIIIILLFISFQSRSQTFILDKAYMIDVPTKEIKIFIPNFDLVMGKGILRLGDVSIVVIETIPIKNSLDFKFIGILYIDGERYDKVQILMRILEKDLSFRVDNTIFNYHIYDTK